MWQAKQENVGETMIKYMQNGPIMPSCESTVVQNDEFLCKLEQKLIHLSAKYGWLNYHGLQKPWISRIFLGIH